MNSTTLYNRIVKELQQRREKHLFRRTAPYLSDACVDLSSNSYCNLQAVEEISEQALALCKGKISGNLASRLISSYSPLYEELEHEVAQWKKTEAALVFNSGYAANIGIIQAVASRSTEIYSDRLNHASIIDGIRLSGAVSMRYNHNDHQELARLLSRSNAQEKLIVTDTVFSMDGDMAPLQQICECARRFDCMVMIDEAHASGIFGKSLSGCAEMAGVEKDAAIRMGTMSKAIAGLGGFFAGDTTMRDYLVNHCRSLIYSTALPHVVLAYNLASIRYIRRHPELGPSVLSKAALLRKKLQEAGFDTQQSTSQIIPCMIGDEEKTVALSNRLFLSGFKVPAIRPPAVPAGTARLRFSVHNGISEQAINELCSLMSAWKEEQNHVLH